MNNLKERVVICGKEVMGAVTCLSCCTFICGTVPPDVVRASSQTRQGLANEAYLITTNHCNPSEYLLASSASDLSPHLLFPSYPLLCLLHGSSVSVIPSGYEYKSRKATKLRGIIINHLQAM